MHMNRQLVWYKGGPVIWLHHRNSMQGCGRVDPLFAKWGALALLRRRSLVLSVAQAFLIYTK